MNIYDSQSMENLLIGDGHNKSEDIQDANLLVFNTCSIREKADNKLFSDLGRANLLKQKNRDNNFLIIVTGCVAQSMKEAIFVQHPYVDAVLGPQDIQNVSQVVKDILGNKNIDKIVLADLNPNDKFEKLNKTKFSRKGSVSEFLTIQEGCDNFCTYCIVPYTRGREFSRSVREILTEAKKMLNCGVKEIILLGQNVNSYRGEVEVGGRANLSQLLWELSSLEGLKRLRYVTSNPKDVDEDIAKAHRDIPSLMPFLHLPVQSGSDTVLKKMNRKYDREKYFEIIGMLREYRPDMAFSSDFIVGFPEETEKDFQDTLDLAEKVKYSQAYSFKYSPRLHTAAAKMENQVSEDIKSRRLQILQDLLNEQQKNYNAGSVGKKSKVLLIKEGKHPGQLVGKNEYFQSVTVDSDKVKIGDIVDVCIKDVGSHSLIGEICGR